MIDPVPPLLHQDAPEIRSGGRAIGIHHDLTAGPGYTLRHRLLRGEPELLRDLIARQHLDRIRSLAPEAEAVVAGHAEGGGLEEKFGPVLISDDELDWRLVRPHQEDDVEPVHADRWYSHRRDDWKHHDEFRHGLLELQFDEEVAALPLLPLEPGHLGMFHDLLFHGGVVNRGRTCRVGLEFTLFFRRDAGPDSRRREMAFARTDLVGVSSEPER